MRKQEIVTVPSTPAHPRDGGKQFQITEMDATTAEKWGMRMFLALKGAGPSNQVSDAVASMGMVGVAIAGLNVFLRAEIDPDVLLPLLDEMFSCVQLIRDPSRPDKDTGKQIASPIVSPDDIEDVPTRLWLRSEVLRVHTDFSLADVVWKLISASTTAAFSST